MKNSRADTTAATTAADDQDARNDGNSPEAAGLVRGLSRFFQRGAVGRLPRRIPVKQIRKLSDQASRGVDMITNISEAISDDDSNFSKSSQRRALIQRAYAVSASFLKTLAKSTILGTIVFDTYERSVKYLVGNCEPRTDQFFNVAPNKGHESSNERSVEDDNDEDSPSTDYRLIASVPQHFLAGVVAGSVHSGLSLSFDCIQSCSKAPLLLFRSTTIHHSIAHSVLFGGYECMKRPLNAFAEATSEPDGVSLSVSWYQVLATGFAGGMSGVLQHVVSHYSGMWLRVETDLISQYHWDQASGSHHHRASLRRLFLPLPTFQPALVAFPTTSIAFLAFEFARGMSEKEE